MSVKPFSATAPVKALAGSNTEASITFTGDTDTGLYSPGSNQVAVTTGGTQRLLIDGDGNITVANKFSIPLGTQELPSLYFGTDINTGIYSPGADQLALSTNGVERLAIENDGDVRFGSSVNYGWIRGWSPTTGDMIIGADQSATGTGGSNLIFRNRGSERLRITSAGLVGIGTSSPSNTLHVVGAGRFNVSGANNAVIASDGGDPFIYTEQAAALKLGTNSAVRMTIDSSGSVGIGTTSPVDTLQINKNATNAASGGLTLKSADSNESFLSLGVSTSLGKACITSSENGSGTVLPIAFTVGSSSTDERMRIDSSGRLLVGTSSAVGTSSGTGLIVRSPVNNNHAGEILLQNAYTRPGDGSAVGSIKFQDSEGSTYAKITGNQDGTASSSSDVPGRLVFSTTADGASSPTERMIIKNNGNILVGSNSDAGFTFQVSKASAAAGYFNRDTDDGAVVGFGRQTSLVGTISVTTTATAYNTSSDYRLKENITPVTDGITRLQQLKPSRFNFIADPDKTVDGFLAHEVQTIVPEAITGEKDAVDDEGNPQYQGIDQSKLVPLLTAALQEAIGRIKTLEAEVAALKAS